MTDATQLKVQEIGEQQLLKRLQSFCPPDVVGDDAAVLALQPGRSLVVTSDMLVDGVHFSEQTTAPEDAGWRAVAANLSDLAAMGATPLGITVSLGLPGSTLVDWVDRLYRGMTNCLQQYQTAIVGGDVCRSPVTTIAITAVGTVAPNCTLRRSTARPGQAIVVTGPHGASRAGLELLLHPEAGTSLADIDRQSLIQAHQRPRPRLDVLEALHHLNIQPSALAGMDSSDGLADAVLQICRASGVGARLERSQISVPPALINWVGPQRALEWALYGGEDFELVLCLPPVQARSLVTQVGTGAALIGEVTAQSTVMLIDAVGQEADQLLTFEQGFQHFEPVESKIT